MGTQISHNKYNSIDLGKFIMAICVIALHTYPIQGVHNRAVIEIYSNFLSCAVPFFFLSAGFLLAEKFAPEFNSDKNVTAVRKYFTRMLKMYLIWTVIYLPLAIDYYKQDYSAVKALASFGRNLIFVGEQYNAWILWYLLSSVYAMLFIYVAMKRRCSLERICLFSCIIIAISIMADWLVDYTGNLPVYLLTVKTLIVHTIRSGRVLTGLFYIPIGMYISQKKIAGKYAAPAFIVLFAANCVCNIYLVNALLTVVKGVVLFLAVKELVLTDKPIYPVLRTLSTGMYFIHLYVWTICYSIIYKEQTYGLAIFAVTTVVSALIAFAAMKIKPAITVLHKQ